MVETVRIGVTGTGGLGTHVLRELDEVDGAEIAALADISRESLSRAAETFGVADDHCYDDHVAMLDAEDLDGVVIATPHALHYEQTVAALDRGVDTLCEKPLCIDLDRARDLVRRSDEADATLMVGYQRHLMPAYRRARDELEIQTGDPQFITAEVTQDWIANQRGSWRSNPDLSGGGQLYDTGSHLLDVVLWTTNLVPVSVNAQMLFADDERRVDKQAALDIQFDNGAVATVAVSGDVPTVREHFHVWGPEGGFYVEGDDWSTRDLTYIDADGEESEPPLDAYDAPTKAAAFVRVVRDDAEPPAKPRDALKVTAVTEAAYESATTGRRVDIDLGDFE
ncbi:Gfo/Idh/MocA family protein [Candidatus Halobonum tyrrellensis]|uniref:Oxidoreductase domain-containing protein n=1 Tax=Candidatus Halobonum tyrrellensis G22 TaxID=1324957 RepID=V4GX46_9EURY|nr:Gfo/Idh/MocA family oxidoreductase [Candidatus Halobonum tyrrellensis]ESP89746.1 oxidoreductase domain-containing protein [Candidatus Halobonum tyrrellensis G22]